MIFEASSGPRTVIITHENLANRSAEESGIKYHSRLWCEHRDIMLGYELGIHCRSQPIHSATQIRMAGDSSRLESLPDPHKMSQSTRCTLEVTLSFCLASMPLAEWWWVYILRDSFDCLHHFDSREYAFAFVVLLFAIGPNQFVHDIMLEKDQRLIHAHAIIHTQLGSQKTSVRILNAELAQVLLFSSECCVTFEVCKIRASGNR